MAALDFEWDDDNIEHSVMMFIDGCIMGKQR